MWKIVVLVLLWLSVVFQGIAQNPVVRWESLPEIKSGVKIRSFSSYNPTGRTFRDFRNYNHVENRSYYLTSHYGLPGMLVGLWFTSLGQSDTRFGRGRFGDISLYFTDDSYPDYKKQREYYFEVSKFPHLKPLWDTYGGAQWGFPCISFDSVFLARTTQAPHWYQFTTHLYRDKKYSEVLTNDQIINLNEKLKNYLGHFSGENEGEDKVESTKTLRGTTEIFNSLNEGVIKAIYIRLPKYSEEILDNVKIKIRTDGHAIPDVNVPLSIFFGGYLGSPISNAQGMPCGFDEEKLYFFFPVPFWNSCSIDLENTLEYPIDISYSIEYITKNEYDRINTGTFKIQYNDGIFVPKGKPDFAHLQTKGSGKIVGVTANLAGSIEGNFRIYIDDSKTPAIETTGGEDYFCHAFGIDVGNCTPFHGGLNDKIGYRFHIPDYIPFLRSVSLGQDHGHNQSHDTDGTFRSAVFYYLNNEQKLMLSDSIDVGDSKAEKAHNYLISGSRSRMQKDTACYEGNFTALFTDDGRWTDGSSSFEIKINENNDGVRLRKRINQLAYQQNIDVYVDGEYVGKWFEQGSNYHLLVEENPAEFPDYKTDWKYIKSRYRDTEFEIPDKFTKGKSKLNIALKTIDSEAAVNKNDKGLTNEYFYWIYSYTK